MKCTADKSDFLQPLRDTIPSSHLKKANYINKKALDFCGLPMKSSAKIGSVIRSEVTSVFTNISFATFHHTHVIEQLRQIVVTALQGNRVPIQSLRDIVDLMRKNETSFPHFRNSNTYKLFEPPVFENKKRANGYWF